MHTGFQILWCTKFDIPNLSGKYQKPRIHLSLEHDFYFGNSCDANKSTLHVPGYPYLVHSCASDVIWWMAKHYCQVRAGLGPRLQRHKCQVRAGLGPRLLWVKSAKNWRRRSISCELWTDDKRKMKWNESGFRPPLCTYRLNWAKRASLGWWDDWDATVLQTQDSKFEPWRSEVEHATSRSRRRPTILTFTHGWGRNISCFFQTAETGNRTSNSGMKGSGANHYPRAPAHDKRNTMT